MVFVALTIWASLEGEESSTVLALGLAIYHILVAIYCRVGGEWVTHTSGFVTTHQGGQDETR